MSFGKLILWITRAVLTVVLACDALLFGNVFYRWLTGGWPGVRAWIGHLEGIGGPAVWRERGDPLELVVRSVQSAYEHFFLLCFVLLLATVILFWLHRVVGRRLARVSAVRLSS